MTTFISSQRGLYVPLDRPSFLFIRIDGKLVFLYSCPEDTPVKMKMLCTSASLGYPCASLVRVALTLADRAEVELDVLTVKQLQTTDPQEIDADWIRERLA